MYIYTYIHICIYTYTHIHICTCICIYIQIFGIWSDFAEGSTHDGDSGGGALLHTSDSACLSQELRYSCIRMYMCMYMYMYMYMYVYRLIYVYIYIYREIYMYTPRSNNALHHLSHPAATHCYAPQHTATALQRTAAELQRTAAHCSTL